MIVCCLNVCIASLCGHFAVYENCDSVLLEYLYCQFCGHFAVYSQLCHITDCLILCPARPVDGDEDILF